MTVSGGINRLIYSVFEVSFTRSPAKMQFTHVPPGHQFLSTVACWPAAMSKKVFKSPCLCAYQNAFQAQTRLTIDHDQWLMQATDTFHSQGHSLQPACLHSAAYVVHMCTKSTQARQSMQCYWLATGLAAIVVF